MKSLALLALEAVVVGALLILVFMFVSRYMDVVPAVFVSGALFHLACEATGVNAWYARNYFNRSSITP
jgi:MFS superfamily sulfate permease-like transporter